jgi:ribosomal protein S18 acetylase RimI-like enzyme
MQIRKATTNDLPYLIDFTLNEALEAEGINIDLEHLRLGISKALEDSGKAIYWVLVDQEDVPAGSISAFLEWSDWRAGYYWWIQSLYLRPNQRGKGNALLLIEKVKTEMQKQKGLELRLYVHKNNQIAIKAYKKIGFENSHYQIMQLTPLHQ